MNIAIVGTGYVGLVTGTCFAEVGMNVTCIDRDEAKIAGLRAGAIPIYEPGLGEMVARNAGTGRLRFATDLACCIDGCEIVICAVGTPSGEDGSADLNHVLDVARTFGRLVGKYTLFVTKSTVPVGTSSVVRDTIAGEITSRGVSVGFGVASNPEFLREGAAVNDFMHPDRIIAGVGDDRARSLMERLYAPFISLGHKLIVTDLRSAEMIKYASNAMLATRISFMNDVANLCDRLGADVDAVRAGMGADPRIGRHFLSPGAGYGGSCFPKDVRALIRTAGSAGYDMRVLRAVEAVNEDQKLVLFDKLRAAAGDPAGLTVALWGLAFKPETDDMREAPSIALVRALRGAGCRVRAFDPAASARARLLFGDDVELCDRMYAAAEGADALLIVTEWNQFRMPDLARLRGLMHRPLLIDGRNIYDPRRMRDAGFEYHSVGRP